MFSDIVFFWRQSNWLRHAIFLALAGMEMSWLAPIVISLNPRSWHSPELFFLLGLWGILLVLMLVANALSLRQIDSPLFELAVLAAILLMSLLVVRLYVFWGEPVLSGEWLAVIFTDNDPRRIEVFLTLGVMAYLWWRGVTLLQREIGFFIIGLDFRKGVLGLILGVILYSELVGRSPTLFIYTFFFFSLMAVALGRIEDKMRTRGDAGPGLPPDWLPILSAASASVLLLAAALHAVWNLRSFAWLGKIISPYASGLIRILEPLILAFLSLFEPIFQWLINFIQSHTGPNSSQNPLITMPPTAAEVFGQNGELPSSQIPLWFIILFRYIIPILVTVVVLAILVIWLDRRRKSRHSLHSNEKREMVAAKERLGVKEFLGPGLKRLRDWAGLVGRYGLGRRFYAAVSVRHLYANLQRLAAKRGYARLPAQTPNDYLPLLIQAFPGQEEALQRLTEAYNAVEYGHLMISDQAWQQLQADWESLQLVAKTSKHV